MGLSSSRSGACPSRKGHWSRPGLPLKRPSQRWLCKDARWTTAKANLARIRPLAQQNAVSQKDLDDAIGTELSTRSSVEAAKAAVDAAQADIVLRRPRLLVRGQHFGAEAQVLASKANVEKAELNLGFSKIVSPVDGSPESPRPRSATWWDPGR